MKKTCVVLFCALAGVLSGCSSSQHVVENPSLTPSSADIITGQTIQFTTNISNTPSALTWSVNAIAGGNSSVGTIDANGNYTAPAAQPSSAVLVSVADTRFPTNVASAPVTVVGSGQVASTANPQVALYTISPPVAASVSIQFGTDISYGLTTSVQMAAGNAAPLGTYVAGMKANTVYHMRAVLQMPDGTQLDDADHTFTTKSLPANELPQLTVSTPNGLQPQPGIELLDLINSGAVPTVLATDLAGNVIWSYVAGGSGADLVQPVKLLPNGHYLVVDAPNSADPLTMSSYPAGTVNVVREIDLAGNTIREISIDTLNSRLATAGFNYTADVFHHDVAILPNGHWIVLVNSTQQFTNLTGLPGTTTVLGDALIDLDTNLNPVWLWNTFDHLDVNRHPFSFPDWTHSNAILYSATDGNLVLSMRHQNWIIKIDYANGTGAGDIIWHLGEGGDFTLQGGTDPVDWFYAQHGPSFTSTNTSGTFGLAVFDNGDDRIYPSGETCQTYGSPRCPYSTSQVYSINESAKTATLTFLDQLSTYSSFGGNAEILANANDEFDLCSLPTTPASAQVMEVTPTSPAETVWQMTINNSSAYRAFRMPSLYPNVQW